MLTAERLRELLHYDPETGVFTNKANRGNRCRVGERVGTLAKTGYLVITLDYRTHLAHRLAWLYVHGRFPEQQVDHINGNRSDNRIANLREATPHVNTQNRRSASRASASGLVGVSWATRQAKWVATITAHRKQHFLGYFKTPEEAHAAYLAAKRRLHEGCTI